MKRYIILISTVLIISSCGSNNGTAVDNGSNKSNTIDKFVGLWKCNSIAATDEKGKDLGLSDIITKCDGIIKKIENTEEGYYFYLCNDVFSMAKKDDNTLSGDGFTLIFDEGTQKLIGKYSTYQGITATTQNWVYEFHKQK